MSKEKNLKSMTGIVSSNKMDKTVVVLVEYKVLHPLYKKYVKMSKKFKAHDEKNECQIGDKIVIESCKPISKDKKWILKEIVTKAR